MQDVRAMVYRQWAIVDGWEGADVDWGPPNEVVDKEYKQHREGQIWKRTC